MQGEGSAKTEILGEELGAPKTRAAYSRLRSNPRLLALVLFVSRPFSRIGQSLERNVSLLVARNSRDLPLFANPFFG